MTQRRKCPKNEKNVDFIVSTIWNGHADAYQLHLLPIFNTKATDSEWTEALLKVLPEIKKYREGQKLVKGNTNAVKRNHTLLKWKVFERDNFTCKFCGKRQDLEIDHIKPVTKGGGNEIENLQTLCKRCNSKKGNKYAV